MVENVPRSWISSRCASSIGSTSRSMNWRSDARISRSSSGMFRSGTRVDLLADGGERAALLDLLAVRVLDREHLPLDELAERRADLEELVGDVQERHAGGPPRRKLPTGRIAHHYSTAGTT